MFFSFIGAGSFTAISVLLMMFYNHLEYLSHTGFIIIILSLFGVGRAAWEGPIKATYLDFYDGDLKSAAFANMIMYNAFPSGLAFLFFNNKTFYQISWLNTSIICLAISAASLAAYLII